MKLILSRKGFDSSAGGCPSPVFPDGSCYALPIPDTRSRIAYRDIEFNGINVGKLVRDLTGDRRGGLRKAHLDPDIIEPVRPRIAGWRPNLGQTGSAQGHLSKQQVSEGDLFLFFGLFREVHKVRNRWAFLPGSRPFHGLWGWLQIGEIHHIDSLQPDALPWAADHPHFHGKEDSRNTLYVASETLNMDSCRTAPGAGVFGQMQSEHRLTAPDARNTTQWRLPLAFYPDQVADAMTYHQNLERWTRQADHCQLKSAARGQEFVIDAKNKPALRHWAADLINRRSSL